MVKRKKVRRKPRVISVREGSYYPRPLDYLGYEIKPSPTPSLKKGAERYHRRKGVEVPSGTKVKQIHKPVKKRKKRPRLLPTRIGPYAYGQPKKERWGLM